MMLLHSLSLDRKLIYKFGILFQMLEFERSLEIDYGSLEKIWTLNEVVEALFDYTMMMRMIVEKNEQCISVFFKNFEQISLRIRYNKITTINKLIINVERYQYRHRPKILLILPLPNRRPIPSHSTSSPLLS